MWKPEFLAHAEALPLDLSGQSVKRQKYLSEERRRQELNTSAIWSTEVRRPY